jgi:asparagine synthase (glutamine-hydrolysing)
MCGIVGVVSLMPTFRIEKTMLERMVSAIVHRGPDGKGFYLDNRVGLGHCRLSIIDIDHGGQPMANEDGTIWICYNGEIYNYLDLRVDLVSKGHCFKTQSDTEVILHLYEEYRDDCVNFLNGMFAFAIWDKAQQRLLLARDRMGIKPLYYARTERALLFGSEAKALFASGLVRPLLDARSIDNFFSFTYPLQPRSMFREVKQVLPAEEVVIEQGKISSRRYWTLHFEEPPRTRPIREYAEELLALLKKSVKRQLMSDVPLGAYLSGGIDSTVVVALMKNLNNSPPETFSVGYNDPTLDESETFQATARSLGVVNHTMLAEPSFADSYPRVIWHLEMPFRHPISIPYYHLSRFVSERGVKVVLTGEGSDEIFGAYDAFVADKFRRILASFHSRFLTRLAYTVACRMRSQSDSLEYLMKAHFDEPPALLCKRYGTVPPWYYHWRMLDSFRQCIFSSTMREELENVDVEEELVEMDKSPINGLHPHNASIWLETQTRLPNWILLIGDRCSMAHGVEARVPYFDNELVEYLARLPVSLKLRGFTPKFILRQAAKGLIPDDIVKRQKFAFRTPIGPWFFNDHPPDFVDEMLCENLIREVGIFDYKELTKARALLATSTQGTHERLCLEYLLFGILGVQTLSVVMKSF